MPVKAQPVRLLNRFVDDAGSAHTVVVVGTAEARLGALATLTINGAAATIEEGRQVIRDLANRWFDWLRYISTSWSAVSPSMIAASAPSSTQRRALLEIRPQRRALLGALRCACYLTLGSVAGTCRESCDSLITEGDG